MRGEKREKGSSDNWIYSSDAASYIKITAVMLREHSDMTIDEVINAFVRYWEITEVEDK